MKIEIANRQRRMALDRKAIRALCRHILTDHGRRGDLSICVVRDAEIRQLNARYLGRDEPTDVLAFPLDDDFTPTDEPPLVGEVVVSADRALDEAARRNIPPRRELALYVAHGLLHLLGYDDRSEADRRRMRRAETDALTRTGVIEGKRAT